MNHFILRSAFPGELRLEGVKETLSFVCRLLPSRDRDGVGMGLLAHQRL
jgi:hypothetical protein